MLAGTFREWVEQDTPGIFIAADGPGLRCRIQQAEYTPGTITYEVRCSSLGNVPVQFASVADVIAGGHADWETSGEVIDG